jgi:hypothetical protein
VLFVRREFSLSGGQGDIEIPFRIEALKSGSKLID